jgi:hypothetical protein
MLEQILDEINKQKKVAEIDLSEVSPRAYPYKKGQVDSAKNKLEGLYIDYKNELLNRAVFILVTGNKSKEFANIAQKEYKCFSMAGETLAEEVVQEINPELYKGKTINASIFDVIDSVLEKKMKSLDVLSYNSLMFNVKYQKVVNTKDEMISVTKDAINDIVGGEVVALDALERAAKEAVNKNYKSKIVPILIYSEDFNLIKTLSRDIIKINPRIVRVLAGETTEKQDLNTIANLENIDSEGVGEALKKIAANA